MRTIRKKLFIFNKLPAFISLLVLLFPQMSWAGVTFQFNGQDEEKTPVYNQQNCLDNKKIEFAWKFTPDPGEILATGKTFEIKYYVGQAATDDSTLFFEENPSQVALYTAQYTGSVKSENIPGFTKDGQLTIRDIIGYHRKQEDPAVDLKNICQLTAPQEGGTKSVPLIIKVKYEYNSTTQIGQTEKKTLEGTLQIRFDLTPPLAPSDLSLTPSERSLNATWKSSESNATFEVYYSTKSFDPQTVDVNQLTKASCASASTPSCKITNLENKVTYYVAVRTVDEAGNVGALSKVQSAQPIDLIDFYEAYRQAGGKDKGFSGGGYCFIATAAYGTYDDKYVKILRDFRDRILLTNDLGQAFVVWYYRHSPPWANWLRHSPIARRITQILLLPLIIFAAFFVRLSPFFQFLFFSLLLLLLFRRFLPKRWWRTPTFLGLIFLLFALPTQARAEEESSASPRNFGFELRLGPYSPQIDSEGNMGHNKPYESYFGTLPQFYVESSFEWLFFKDFGTLGLTASVGFTWAQGEAKMTNTLKQPLVVPSSQSLQTTETTTTTEDKKDTNETGLWIVPFRLGLAYRFDYLTERYGFPIVPYIRAGLDYFLWWITDSNGSIASYKEGDSSSNAIGGRLGVHFAFGIQLLLDIFDPTAARTFDVESGVNHTYLFAEWNITQFGLFSQGLNLSDSSIRAGLMLQF